MDPQLVDTGKVYSIKPEDRKGDFTFTRSSAATRVNASGNIEKQTSNYILYSQQIDNGYWNKYQMSVTANQAAAPDGTATADLIDDGTGTGTHAIEENETIGYGGAVTISIHAKYVDTQYLVLAVYDTAYRVVVFDIQNGTIGNKSLSSLIATIEDLGSGWYRCAVTHPTNTRSNPFYTFGLRDDNVAALYTLAGSNRQAYVWGAQMEDGLVARDYIETTTSAIEGGITDNVPRLDYTDSSCPALLLEPQRTNLLTNSEYFGGYSNSNSTDTANDATSPEGVDNATSFKEAATTGQHKLFTSATFDGSSTYTFSIFAKDNGRDLYIDTQNSNEWGGRAWFDLSAGTANAVLGSASIEDYGDGWYRCVVTGDSSTSGSNFIELLTSDGSTNSTTGDTTKGVYIFGAQLEAGSYATSYIPTYGSSVTRVADTYKKLSFGNTSTEGTFYAEFEVKKIESANGQYMYGLSVGTTDLGDFYANASGALSIIANGPEIQGFNNGYVDSLFSYTPSIGDIAKIAIRYDGSNVVAFVNGVKQTTKTDNASGVKNSIRVNHGEKSSHATKQLLFIPTALTDQEAIALTTI